MTKAVWRHCPSGPVWRKDDRNLLEGCFLSTIFLKIISKHVERWFPNNKYDILNQQQNNILGITSRCDLREFFRKFISESRVLLVTSFKGIFFQNFNRVFCKILESRRMLSRTWGIFEIQLNENFSKFQSHIFRKISKFLWIFFMHLICSPDRDLQDDAH